MLHSFTRNYNDLSTEAGFQFEYFCDCCGNGFKSSFMESSTYGKQQKTRRFGGLSGTIGGIMGSFGSGLGSNIGHAVELGTGMQIIQGKSVGDYSIVGAGAVVVKDIPEKCTAVGSPAKPIKFFE